MECSTVGELKTIRNFCEGMFFVDQQGNRMKSNCCLCLCLMAVTNEPVELNM